MPAPTKRYLLTGLMRFFNPNKRFLAASSVLLLALGISARAQSSEQDLPTPVRSLEINGVIKALDIGDPRSTRHFYAFNGTHGDLLITVEGRNLNGDVDVFTAVTLKPLVKIPMYAQSSSPTTKSIYIRAEEILILRVEARSPNDDPGQYRIRFGGAFASFSGGIPVQEEEAAASAPEPIRISSGRTTRRSSVGARIDEPRVEPKPSPTPAVEEKPADSGEAEKPKVSAANRTRPPRRPPKAKPSSETTKKEPDKAKPSEATVEEKTEDSKPPAPEKKNEEEPKQEIIPSPQQPNAHLIIEEKDGTKIDRPMSTVRRLLIDNGVITIFLKNGRIDKINLADIARMTIEPQ